MESHIPSPQVVGLDSGPEPGWLSGAGVSDIASAEGLSFELSEYEDRLKRLRARMQQQRLDALMIFRPSSVEYLCGFHTAETAPQPLLITETQSILYVPDLEVGRALTSSAVGSIAYCGYADALIGLEQFISHAARTVGSGARLGLDLGHPSTPPQALRIWQSTEAEVIDADHLVEYMRLVLSPAERQCVEKAASVTQAGVEAAISAAGRVGATDADVGAAIASALYRQADSMSAWGPLVVTGKRSGIPHSSWNGSRLADGPTFIELSGVHHRYHAPVMRTLLHGPPEATDTRLIELARTAVEAVLDAARPGVTAGDVAAAASHALGALPEDVMFHQLFGYPVGLAHKPHWMDSAPCHLAAGNATVLQEGMVFHIPAAFRAFGKQGVGLSQTFVVEEAGARVITFGPADVTRIGE